MIKSPNQINIDKMLERMDVIQEQSPTMCTAKWLQSTVYLMNGFTHSCHHPSAHKILLEEIEKSPTALHNTVYKKQQRKMMLSGLRPAECGYCWNIEDLPGNHMSDRVYKSTDTNWSFPYLHKIKEAGATNDINPTYLEVAFENTCNFKCAYCTPDISSKWMEEIKQHGAYKTSSQTGNLEWLKSADRLPIPHREYNPYVDAFWKWWPDLYKDLETFRITGGEPLLSKNTWKILEYVKQNPRKDFTLAINTNMDVPKQFIDKLIKYYIEIAPHIKSFDLYTSCEATGRQADYIRYGMKYERFMKNVRRYLTETGPTSRVNFMITFNILSITTFKYFLRDLWQLRVDFNPDDSLNRIPIMIAYLRWPRFMSMQILPQELKHKYCKEFKDFVDKHTRITSSNKAGRFYLEEIDQLDRLCEFMLKKSDNEVIDKKDFAIYFDEYDRRRGTNFEETFPELLEFIQECRIVV